MGARLLKYLLSTNTGRFALLGLIIVGVAFAARTYYDQVTQPPSAVAKLSQEGLLAGMVDATELWVATHSEQPRAFPDDTPWTPAVLECGRPGHATPQEAAHPTWKALGATFEEPSLYQLRFTATAQGYELLARTDADCDGLYEVLRRTGSVGYSGLSSDPVKMDNPGE